MRATLRHRRVEKGDDTVDVVDDTFVSACPVRLAEVVKDPRNHANWWPHLRLELLRERGAKGAEWSVSGQLTGTLEIWLEPFWDGAIVHHYVRGERTADAPADLARRHVLRWKRAVTRLKDVLEDDVGVGADWVSE